MAKQNTQFDFGDDWEVERDFVLYEKIISDRGSKYSVSIGRVESEADIKAFLARLKSNKKYAKATHNTYAARMRNEGRIIETKNDDGEVGAGQTILRVMEREGVVNAVVCVTRWFGGTQLGGDRFRHVQDATKIGIAQECSDTTSM
jgi:putative IMPACT (imprinted ancient) family translation regulator